MHSTPDFVQKLEKILSYYQLSASAFADKIGVQRSSLSHLLSGRNKPSLEFVIKISESFPEVDLYWFLFNKGTFPKSNTTDTTQKKADDSIKKTEESRKAETNRIDKIGLQNSEDVEKIVVFYKNGTFKTYLPK
ncbi:MAG: helix-turn-helix transcriptional regulator [Flavobacterium sp.]|nr:helix-turn-helix transcriptional regulator [Flavobacterium sp.]